MAKIEEWAFSECTALTDIVIPNSVGEIGLSAFDGCTSLATIEFKGTSDQWENVRKSTNWNRNIIATEVICSGDITN